MNYKRGVVNCDFQIHKSTATGGAYQIKFHNLHHEATVT